MAEIRKEREGLGKERIAELEEAAKAFQEKYEALRTELGRQFDARPGIVEKRAKAGELGERIGAIRKELDEKNTDLPAKRAVMEEARRTLSTIENDARKAFQERAGILDDVLNEQYNQLVADAKFEDAPYQAALNAVEAMRERMAALPGDTAPEERQQVQAELQTLEQQRRREEQRVVSAPGIVRIHDLLQAARRRTDDLRRRAVETAPGRKQAQAKLEAARAAYQAAERRRYDDPRLHALNKQLEAVSTRRERDEFVRRSSMATFIEMKQKQAAVDTYRIRVQMLNNADEHYGIGAWGSGNFGRGIGAYLAQYRPFSITENEDTLQRVFDAQQSKWVTEVDWDSRMEFEMGGRDGLAPHQLRWLKRVKPHAYK